MRVAGVGTKAKKLKGKDLKEKTLKNQNLGQMRKIRENRPGEKRLSVDPVGEGSTPKASGSERLTFLYRGG